MHGQHPQNIGGEEKYFIGIRECANNEHWEKSGRNTEKIKQST